MTERRKFIEGLLIEKGTLERQLAAVDALILVCATSGRRDDTDPPAEDPPVPEPPPAPPVVEPPPEIAPAPAAEVEPPLTPLPYDVHRDQEGKPSPPLKAVFLTDTRKFYPARNEIICREWPRGTGVKEIEAMLNELPGAPIASDRIPGQAARLDVHRPGRNPSNPFALKQDLTQVPPKDRMSVLRQVAASLKPPPIPATMPGAAPIAVEFEQVRRWAGERGMQFRTWEDLPQVNRKREQLGQATFKRNFPR